VGVDLPLAHLPACRGGTILAESCSRRGQVGLGMEVNSKNALPHLGQGSGEVHGRGVLADTPFLIGERDDMRQWAPFQRAIGARKGD